MEEGWSLYFSDFIVLTIIKDFFKADDSQKWNMDAGTNFNILSISALIVLNLV